MKMMRMWSIAVLGFDAVPDLNCFNLPRRVLWSETPCGAQAERIQVFGCVSICCKDSNESLGKREGRAREVIQISGSGNGMSSSAEVWYSKEAVQVCEEGTMMSHFNVHLSQ